MALRHLHFFYRPDTMSVSVDGRQTRAVLRKGKYLVQNDKRVRIISGHYGSGKTEFAVNYAVKLAESGRNPVLADIDVINPYFRSRETAAVLKEMGIDVIASSTDATALSVPAISARVFSVFDDKSRDAVLDVGGEQNGITVLNRFSDHFDKTEEYDFFIVINAYRQATSDASQVEDYIRSFEEICGLSVSGLINNTHMLKSTTAADVICGFNLAVEVSDKTGIPLKYSTGLSMLEAGLPDEIRADFFPLKLYMREDWMT